GLKPRDLILEVDGKAIDNAGYYRDEELGLQILENLSTRGKLAGDILKFKVWRNGKAIDVDYKLPAVDYGHKLVPTATYGRDPEYLVVGGLLFQPLTVPLLEIYGESWQSRAPYQLTSRVDNSPSAKRSGLVVCTMVIPDPFNLGYQDLRFVVLDKVNGQSISDLGDIREALKNPEDGFHNISFTKGSRVENIVLDAAKEPAATAKILRHYRIPAPTFFDLKAGG
ncbi:MAG: PDZ domain-containing protein, partial [Limisphaerales bacterium]